MFKKASVLTKHALSKQDVKRLKKDVRLAMPALSEEDVDLLVPSKAEVVLSKLSNRALVYAVEGCNPILFDPEGENDLYPTVYLLWQFPKALPALWTHSEVSPKILGGADLMLQGVITPPGGLGEWAEEEARVVALPENHYPFGVGAMVVPSASLKTTGLKGRGLRLLHHYGDPLWALGDKSVPDASFTPDRIYPLGAVPPEALAAAAASAAVAAAAAAAAAEAAEAASAEPMAALSLAEPAAPAGPAVDTATPEGMDAMLDWCLLRGLVEKGGDGELPVKCEEFYSKVLLPARPPGTTVDIKKSGYKKLAKLYSVWEKKGLLTVKAVHKIDNIVAVNRAHPAYAAAAAEAAAATGSADPAATAAAAPAVAMAALIEVDALYRSSSSLRPIFGDLLATNKERLLSEPDVAACLRSYAAANQLLPPGTTAASTTQILLDDLLIGGLYGKKEGAVLGAPAPLDDVLARLLARLSLFTRLRIQRAGGAAPEEVLQKGSIKNIKVVAEDRHAGRKHVTKVTGVEAFAIDPDELSSRVQKGYNTSCSVAPLPGKNETGKEICAMGNLLAEVGALLRAQYGISEAYVDLVDKTK